MSAKDLRRSLLLTVAILTLSLSKSKQLKPCNQKTRGVRLLYSNRIGNDVLVMCVMENMHYHWKFVDGSSTFGEKFNPAKDCADIVDNLEDAKNGFYWILFNKSKPQKVWCDVRTDGGGFMLVGMKDNPESWTVPSNSTPVDPQGPPHWSSSLGDVGMVDFGIQVSLDKTFQSTKAHWIYHFKTKRKFGNLFSNDPSKGCTTIHPGIGDVMYVKDGTTGRIVTANFSCSKFGTHSHNSLGWARMNYCLRRKCKYGYGVLLLAGSFPFRYDDFGSFSYSAVFPSSGIGENSTAFVGCDHAKCCACFGPQGGNRNYCGPKCTAINGGTVTKKAVVWFWVRTRRPKRLWTRCMEFMLKKPSGKLEKHIIDHVTGTTRKGSCSYKFKALLNEGTLTVANKKSLEQIPEVPGLLSYRKDNGELYVNQGSQWQALNNKKEVAAMKTELKNQTVNSNRQLKKLENKLQQEVQNQKSKYKIYENSLKVLEQEVKNQQKELKKQEKTISNLTAVIKDLADVQSVTKSCSALRVKNARLPSGLYKINPKGQGYSPFLVFCDMDTQTGVGVTVVRHDSESRTDAKANAHSKPKKIQYVLLMRQISAIIKQSKNCEQFIKYECFNSVLSLPHAWWASRQGTKMNYWGGAAVNSRKCACGMTNSCAGGGRCNCDKNDSTWREDSGYLTDKSALPVTELKFIDLGGGEFGYFTLGRLRCWG